MNGILKKCKRVFISILLFAGLFLIFPAYLLYPQPSDKALIDIPDRIDKDAVRVVVIDPGHGGDDKGATGSLMDEKDIVLNIAKKLHQLLIDEGIGAFLTRDGDYSVPLSDRTGFANSKGASLFISIHVNYSKRKEARGIETFFLSEKSSDKETEEVVNQENLPFLKKDDSRTIELILWDLVQMEFIDESRNLAECIQKNVIDVTGNENRGIKQGPFYVLRGAKMPAALIETGFIQNPDDYSRLIKDEYQWILAKSIFKGIVDFSKILKKKIKK